MTSSQMYNKMGGHQSGPLRIPCKLTLSFDESVKLIEAYAPRVIRCQRCGVLACIGVFGTGITTYALHPGVVASDIWRRVPWPVRPIVTRRLLPVSDGAATSLYCATSPEMAEASGLFYDKCAERAASPVATPELGRLLWDRSEAWTASGASSASSASSASGASGGETGAA
jgi:hypothetical protein